MEREAYRAYVEESNSWLRRGRSVLLDVLVSGLPTHAAGRDILDVGAGVGSNVPVLGKYGSVDVVEPDPAGLAVLRHVPGIRRAFEDSVPFDLSHSYDLITAMDVVEHLANDRLAIDWMFEHLVSGGGFVAFAPAYQWLYGPHDIALGHHRRYTKRTLAERLPRSAVVLRSGYFNSLLLPLAVATRAAAKFWGRIRRSEVARKQASRVPAPVDRLFGRVLQYEAKRLRTGGALPFGLSVYVVARKD